MVRARLLGQRAGRHAGVADADEEAFRGVEERLLGLLAGYRRRSHARNPAVMYAIAAAAAGASAGTQLLDRQPADVRERRTHWKISVVQSPPGRRISCARAGPPGRSWKSTKKSRSSSIPPSGSQFTRSSHERSSG